MQDLDLSSRDKLAFVYQTVYNSGPVKLIRKSEKDGSISASCQKMLNILVKVSVWSGSQRRHKVCWTQVLFHCRNTGRFC